MPNKELTARVKLDIKDAESKLKRLDTLIKSINKAVTGTSNTGKLENAINKQVIAAEKVKQATLRTQLAEEKLTTQKSRSAVASQNVESATIRTQIAEQRLALQVEKTKAGIEKCHQASRKLPTTVEKVSTALSTLNNKLKNTRSLFGDISSMVKRLASAIIGIGTLRLAVQGADTLTGAENRFNNIAAQQMGDNAYNTDTSGNVTGYSDKALRFTQEAMDKIYVSAQKTRTEYANMLSNVSKTMTLAPDAFQGNVDNAIRFHEIMSEAYAVGGASAAEMSTSMYQLTQALGAGTLAGDELRSVREGAPLAYKKIEEFAQGVYNTSESLKDLAADGKITSDMVVAAVMNMGNEMDRAFAMTKFRFSDVWNQIKSAGQKAFEPVVKMLTEKLNEAVDNGLVQKFETFFMNVAKAVMIVFTVVENVVNWIADNFDWLKWVVIGVLTVMVAWMLFKKGIAIACAVAEFLAWASVNTQLLIQVAIIVIIMIAILALLAVFLLWKTGAINTCQAIVSALLIVGIAVALIGLLIGNWIVVIIGLVIAAIGLIINYLDYFLAILYSIVSVIWNLIVTLVTAIIKNAIVPLTTAWDNFANFFGNLFNDPIAAIIRCFEKLADSVLSILETIAMGIDSIFGSNLASAVQGWRSGLSSKADELVEKYGNGTYEEKSNLTDKITSLLDSVQGELLWNTSDAWKTGKAHGSTAKDWLGGLGSQFQSGFSMDGLGEKLGLDFGEGLLKTDPNNLGVGGSYNVPDDLLGGIKDDTGSIADSMELADEDLEYLRKIAEMEWKKEFTTASITVDMSNYNNISGETDLDGIVTKLADKLYEEMNVVANGVYA